MLKHKNSEPTQPSRVLILGGAGFVGGAACKAFESEGTKVLSLGRSEIDLLSVGAAKSIAGYHGVP